ncbi:MAG: hypothetical protein JO356_18035 [Acidobacteria bacterium]|nr:hypothetical protein [Acidobacteriota bacterium]
MAIIVIGGQSRNVGKTSVVAGLIEALPSYAWTAIKITQFGHGRCSVNGKACHCSTPDHRFSISEEKQPSTKTDTSRFLRAGAKRVFWVRAEQGRLGEVVPALRGLLSQAENSIIESNSIVRFIRPDLYLTVLDPGIEDWKMSAWTLVERADALIVHRREGALSGEVRLRPLFARPTFSIQPPEYVTDQVIAFVAGHLERLSHSPA